MLRNTGITDARLCAVSGALTLKHPQQDPWSYGAPTFTQSSVSCGSRLVRREIVRALSVALLGFVPAAAQAQIDVLTNRYDGAQRPGANLKETTS